MTKEPWQPDDPAIHPGTRALARFLDGLVTVPGTRMTFGADVLVGLVPGVGDLAGTALSSAILADAVRLGVPLPVIARMLANIAIDTAIGQLPAVGDLGDLAFRSNRMNLALLERAVADAETTRRRSLAYLVGAGAMVLGAVLLMVGGALFTLWWVLKVLHVIE